MRRILSQLAILALAACSPLPSTPSAELPAAAPSPTILQAQPAEATQTALVRIAPPPLPSAATPATVPTALIGTWALETLQSAGREPESTAGSRLALILRADGTSQAKGDCNDAQAPYTFDDHGRFAFGAITATATPCSLSPAHREDRYLDTLNRVRGYALEEGMLRLTFEQPGLQLVFRRTEFPQLLRTRDDVVQEEAVQCPVPIARPPEFRAGAVRLARGSEKAIPAPAADLGISSEALRPWLRRADADERRVESAG